MKKFIQKISLAAALLMASFSTFAVSLGDTAAATITTDGTAAITAVGGALIGLAGVAVVYKWIKGAIFG